MEETLSIFDELFHDDGLLKRGLKGYEPRLGQQEMAREIWEAFENDTSALFEAGTGIGKSLAYLIPALLWSFRTGEKIVISTYTIALQEQLLEKDIPMLIDALGIDLRIVLAKGMGNYVCLRKTDEVSKQHGFFDNSLDAVVSWTDKTTDGTKSAIPFSVTSEAWSRVYAESDACSYVKCPHYRECFFFKARSKVQDADIIIVNHHLLMADLHSDENRAILPPYSRLIVDEAHHLEQVARGSLTRVLDRIRLFKTLARVHSDAHPETSRFLHIKNLVKDKALRTRLGTDLPGEKRQLVTTITSAFDLLDQTYMAYSSAQKWRLTPDVFKTKHWQEELIPAFNAIRDALKRYAVSLKSIEGDIPDELKERVENDLAEFVQTADRAEETAELIDDFFQSEDVRWAERTSEGTTLSVARLDVAPILEEKLFEPLRSAILCSATLTVGGQFTHIKTNLGLSTSLKESLHPSPFDYQNRTRLFGFSDLCAPNSYNFIEEASRIIRKSTEASGGGAFVLFTSYDMLNKCAKHLEDLPLLKQGDLPRQKLLKEFKESGNATLLGTDSFWEGVDVAGEALRLVIIVKLPFPVPSEPILEARSELMRKEGRDPFMEDSIPQAVVKFKQGFGRLMRRKDDRGCVLCLDQRLFNRAYGKVFLRSLPECITSYQSEKQVLAEMQAFYQNWS